MANNQQILLDAARQWFVTVFPDMECLIAEQNMIPPTPENINFGLIRAGGISRQGIDGSNLKYDISIDKFRERSFSVKEVILTLDVFTQDETAEDIINTALVSLVSQKINDAFNRSGIAVLFYDEAINLSKAISSRYARRFQSSIHFGISFVYETLLNRVVEIPYQGTINETIIISGDIKE